MVLGIRCIVPTRDLVLSFELQIADNGKSNCCSELQRL